MITVDGLTVEFGGTTLFKDISFQINEKDRIALMGKNGAGKSTLLKIIAGVRQATRGTVSAPKDCVIAYLPQHLMTEDGRTVFEETCQAFAHLHEMQAEIDRLKTFEDNQTYYEELKKKFDEEVVYTDNAPSIEEYKKWYEEMNPDNAADIYQQVLLKINYTEQVKAWAEAYSKMDAKSAAAILEEMTGDIDLVSDILNNMKSTQRAAILAAMDPVFAAKITKVMHPNEP